MSEFAYTEPGKLANSNFGGKMPMDNYRVKSLLSLFGQGTLKKRNISTQIKLNNCFSVVPHRQSVKLKIIDIVFYAFPGRTKKEISNFFISSCTKNMLFHKKVFFELITALGYLEQSNHIASFVSIYRLYEQIALCLPIITLIDRAQFPATFDDYKQLIDNKAKSDLSVLKKYSENILDSSIGDISICFDFSRTQRARKNTNLFKNLIPQKLHSTVIISSTNTSINIKLKHIHILVINFRNQYFHYLFHEKNIDYDALEYPEEFLGVCNPIFISYYSRLFLDLLGAEFSIWG